MQSTATSKQPTNPSPSPTHTDWVDAEASNPIIKWTEPGQHAEGEYLGSAPLGEKKNLIYSFRRADGHTWRTWETYDLKQKMSQVPEGTLCRIEFVGLDGKMKKFRVRFKR